MFMSAASPIDAPSGMSTWSLPIACRATRSAFASATASSGAFRRACIMRCSRDGLRETRCRGRQRAGLAARLIAEELMRAIHGVAGNADPYRCPQRVRNRQHAFVCDLRERRRQNLLGDTLRGQSMAFAARSAHAERVPRAAPLERERIAWS